MGITYAPTARGERRSPDGGRVLASISSRCHYLDVSIMTASKSWLPSKPRIRIDGIACHRLPWCTALRVLTSTSVRDHVSAMPPYLPRYGPPTKSDDQRLDESGRAKSFDELHNHGRHGASCPVAFPSLRDGGEKHRCITTDAEYV